MNKIYFLCTLIIAAMGSPLWATSQEGDTPTLATTQQNPPDKLHLLQKGSAPSTWARRRLKIAKNIVAMVTARCIYSAAISSARSWAMQPNRTRKSHPHMSSWKLCYANVIESRRLKAEIMHDAYDNLYEKKYRERYK
jgi:hypothetical protein